MRINSLLFTYLLLYVTCIQAQALRTYAPENYGHRTPALFELTGSVRPHWSGQALVGVQDNDSSGPLVYLIDRQGRRDHFSFTFPDAATISIYDFSTSPDGTMALVGSASTADSRWDHT